MYNVHEQSVIETSGKAKQVHILLSTAKRGRWGGLEGERGRREGRGVTQRRGKGAREEEEEEEEVHVHADKKRMGGGSARRIFSTREGGEMC